MSWGSHRAGGPPDEPLPDDEPLGRPFLTAAPRGVRVDHPTENEPAAGAVRPYLLTGGRTVARRRTGPSVAMETILLATGTRVPHRADAAGLERARILRLCDRPCSAAEVAARLQLPLQVTLVLVTDLVAEGLLDATVATLGQADDVPLLERLIAGVAAL